MNAQKNLQADVLITGLPAGGEGFSPTFLRAVHPVLVIVACADAPTRARPTRALREQLRELHVPVIYTAETGAVILTLKHGERSVTTMDGKQVRIESLQPAGPENGSESPGQAEDPGPDEPISDHEPSG